MYDELGPIYDLPARRELWAMRRLHCLKCAHDVNDMVGQH